MVKNMFIAIFATFLPFGQTALMLVTLPWIKYDLIGFAFTLAIPGLTWFIIVKQFFF